MWHSLLFFWICYLNYSSSFQLLEAPALILGLTRTPRKAWQQDSKEYINYWPCAAKRQVWITVDRWRLDTDTPTPSSSQQSRNTQPMLRWCWLTVYHAGPTSPQHRIILLCLLGGPCGQQTANPVCSVSAIKLCTTVDITVTISIFLEGNVTLYFKLNKLIIIHTMTRIYPAIRVVVRIELEDDKWHFNTQASVM